MILPGEFETSLPKLIRAIRALAFGGSNAIGPDVTLSAGTETVVAAPLCGPGALVTLVPLSGSAAEAGAYLKSTSRGSFVLGHVASEATDRVVRFEVRRT